ncbi:MAG: hypothetical protein NT007_07100, partial [Candidatus Kapabacteria bacterium]|nr:hypothetical protein [Candidatus Kapabacteria bacterium]
MKKVFLIILLLMGMKLYSQNVIISDQTDSIPDPSSVLELKTVLRGFLMPRLTGLQRDAIGSPAHGLMIIQTNMYLTDPPGVYYYDSSQTKWININSAYTPFNKILTGSNNSSTMTVANGAFIMAGGGTIQATEFYGTGSTTSMVDLATGEVAGILPVTKGGTGSSNTFGPNTILIGTSGGTITSLPSENNSTLVTNSSGSVYWSTVTPSSVSFSNITTGLNNSASMTVATGASINLQGTGQVQASEFYGTGSTTDMVDLATGEVAGILPVTKG